MRSHVVIGGAGFIGRHVTKALAERGDDVVVVDVVDFPVDAADVKRRQCDLIKADAKAFDEIIGSAEIVHHYLWTSTPATANANPEADIQSNLTVLIKLLEAMKRRGGGRIIFSSSGGTVYGLPQILPIPETHPLEPITAYGAGKIAAEKYLQVYRYLCGVDARIARISNPYGAGQDPLRTLGAVTTFAHRAVCGERIQIWGDGNVVRDFIHIWDVVSALLKLADAENSSENSLTFNLGSGIGSSLNNVLQSIKSHIKSPFRIEYEQMRKFDVPVSYLDISKARQLLGWEPTIPLHIGIGHTIMDIRSDPSRKFSSRISP